jgi:hypothetical protein
MELEGELPVEGRGVGLVVGSSAAESDATGSDVGFFFDWRRAWVFPRLSRSCWESFA